MEGRGDIDVSRLTTGEILVHMYGTFLYMEVGTVGTRVLSVHMCTVTANEY